MTKKGWEDYLTEEDRATLARGKWGQQVKPGSRPAIVAIDVQNYMVGPKEGGDQAYPYSCGQIGWDAVNASGEIIAAARKAGVPLVFTRFALDPSGNDGGLFAQKVGKGEGEYAFVEGTFGSEYVADVAPQPGDIAFTKKKMSAFFGTPLQAYLTDLGVDTIIVLGGSTSNCVRATVVDAAQFNYKVLVPREAVFDRLPLSHAVSLFDMDRSCANVMSKDDVVAYLESLPEQRGR
ncbi:MAG: isochorismatase family protein [Burkholderiaceae bacterium]